MSYIFTERFGPKDLLETGNPNKLIKGTEVDEEFRKISEHLQRTNILASLNFDGSSYQYSYNINDVEKLAPSTYKIRFITPINNDQGIVLPDGTPVNPGDFAAVLTPYTNNGVPVIGFITDQREAWVDVQFRSLINGSWDGPQPENQAFSFVVIDQVPDIS